MAINVDRIKAKVESFNKKTYEKKDLTKVLFKPEKGKKYEVRIVPYKKDLEYPFGEILFHQTKLLGVPYTLVALDPTLDPIIKASNELKKSSSKEARDMGYKLTPKAKQYIPIIVRGEEAAGVRWFGITKDLYTQLLNTAANTKQNGDIIDVNEGSDFELYTVETQMEDITYQKPFMTIFRKSSVLSEDPAQIKEWLENQPDLDAIYDKKTPEELLEVLMKKLKANVVDAPDDNSDDEDEESNEAALDKIFPAAAPVPVVEKTAKSKKSAGADRFAELFE